MAGEWWLDTILAQASEMKRDSAFNAPELYHYLVCRVANFITIAPCHRRAVGIRRDRWMPT